MPPGETTLRRIQAMGRKWTVAMGSWGLRVDADDRTLLSSDAPVVLRKLEVDEGSLFCRTHAQGPVRIRVPHLPDPRGVTLDEKDLIPKTEWIHIPAGEHSIRIVKGSNNP